MHNKLILFVSVCFLVFVSSISCITTQTQTQYYLDRYVEIALSRYRDQSLWEKFDYIDLPRIANPTRIRYREEVGVFHSGSLKGDFPVVTVGVPISDPDNELNGADYVFIQFHHPSGKILIIHPGLIMY